MDLIMFTMLLFSLLTLTIINMFVSLIQHRMFIVAFIMIMSIIEVFLHHCLFVSVLAVQAYITNNSKQCGCHQPFLPSAIEGVDREVLWGADC